MMKNTSSNHDRVPLNASTESSDVLMELEIVSFFSHYVYLHSHVSQWYINGLRGSSQVSNL